MTRPTSSLAVILSATIVAGGVLMGSDVSACPFSGKSSPDGVVRRPDSPDSLGNLNSPNDMRSSNPASTLTGLPKQSQSGVNSAEIAGFGTIVSLLVAGVIYKVRRSRSTGLSEVVLNHPELEHPELTLTSLPKEALPFMEVDQEVVLTR